MNKLMIVAHPDDEMIFGGGALLAERGWKVICLTCGDNEERSREFRKAMYKVGAACEIWDFPDQFGGSFDKDAVREALKSHIYDRRYVKIVTHNLQGEYGHSQHRSISRILHHMDLDHLYVFGKSDTPLPFNILYKKMNVLKIYQSQMYVIETLMPYIVNESIVHAN